MRGRLRKYSSNMWTSDRGPYALLAFLVFVLFVLSPLLSARILMPIVLEISFSIILVSGAFVVSSRVSIRLLAVLVGLLSIALDLVGKSATGKIVVAVDTLISVTMLCWFVFLMAKHFLVRWRSSTQRIAGAVNIYLLLGLIFARLYQVVDFMVPGSFRFPEGEVLNISGLAYFSFVTLATLGYGDITPVSVVARDLAVLEAVTGQLYLVILISRLVSEGTEKSEDTSE
jgi:hypothetical protein